MSGKTALVTGATGGIGFHITHALARTGARVFVTGRDPDRGQRAVDPLRRLAGNDRVEFLLSEGTSVGASRALAEELSRLTDQLDILVNNVGGLRGERELTAEGHEATLALNFLAPLALTTALMPRFTPSGDMRVVNVVSSAFRMWKRDPFDDLTLAGRYVGIEAYARAKLLNLLFTLALARRLEGRGVANAVNPGGAWTPGVEAMPREAVPEWRFVWPLMRWFQRQGTPERAARGPSFLATAPVATMTGRYFEGLKEKPLPSELLERDLQERAWKLGADAVEQRPSD